MVCQCWLLVVVMAYLCVPGLGSGCLESSICNNLSNKGRILTEEPELRTVDSSVVDDDADSDLLLSIILANVAPEDTLDLRARGAERRAYAMEHFRWGKPSGDKAREPKLRGRSNERRSYSMEHFRWGKPPGRKRRPVKVFASSLEGGGSPEVAFPVQVRRQLRADDSDEAREAAQAGSRAGAKSQVPLNLQQRKDGTYRMSHFRWGSPPASKRNGVFARPWEEKPQGLAKIIRNIIVKDVQRIMG
ncbi:pro-opiomelanocortin-like isoform X2 [Salarias fasciatus]|uniref:pro-opiomelanocortin-like isoform X2 n=1 Tax=Salarias fasciatus TaxID=181472 RepID=UPI001176F751|nr:pro-opiomelanocortin-like isoform X2 [Salarias fasciatus]